MCRAQNYIFMPSKYKDCYLAYVLNELSGSSVIMFAMTCSTVQVRMRTVCNPAPPSTHSCACAVWPPRRG